MQGYKVNIDSIYIISIITVERFWKIFFFH